MVFVDSEADLEEKLLEASDEKIPVSSNETIIVMSRTMREQRLRQRRWMALYGAIAFMFFVWLLWALFFTPAF